MHIAVPRGYQDYCHQHHLLGMCVFVLMLVWGPVCQKHAFNLQEMVASVSSRDVVLFLLIVTGKFAAYFILLSLNSVISSACDSHSESEEQSRILSELVESQFSLLSLVLDIIF